jgi:integrase
MSWHEEVPDTDEDLARADEWYEEDVDFNHPVVSDSTIELIEAEFSTLVVERFRDFKEKFLTWLATAGKNHQKREGYALRTVKMTHYKIEDVFRWKWKREGEFSITFDTAEAYTYLASRLAATDQSDRTYTDYEKAIARYHNYERTVNGKDYPSMDDYIEGSEKKPLDFKRNDTTKTEKDKLHKEELRKLYNASLTVYSVKSYNNKRMSKQERQNIKLMLAERFHKPSEEIGPEDFKRANSWKIPSIIAVTSDCGLRPIEVQRAKVDWFDLENNLMIVPKEESTKVEENWECALSEKTITAAGNWLDERETNENYWDSDAMWLTKNANPYKGRSLNRILNKLMEEAGIDAPNRKLSWYSFRHGAATMWAEEQGIYQAKEQLRHKAVETTLRYTRGGNKKRPTDSLW